ncbi:MAG: hypothetical protein ACKOPQ_09450 [Novosphingobium sp.]|jgi:xanthine/uracil permease
MSTPEEDALAKKRFLAMNLVRICGVVLILVGLLCALDKIDIPGARLIGVMFILFGMIDTFVVPVMLAKRWRS